MNEDDRGITPPDVTAMTAELLDGGYWRIIIEQGNGDVIKMFELTEMERLQLGFMLGAGPGQPPSAEHVSFVDWTRMERAE